MSICKINKSSLIVKGILENIILYVPSSQKVSNVPIPVASSLFGKASSNRS